MAGWAANLADIAEAVTDLTAFGEPCTFAPAIGAQVSVLAVPSRDVEPLDPFGGSDESRLVYLINAATVPMRPTTGDVLTTDAGARYALDGDAEAVDGLWRCAIVPVKR